MQTSYIILTARDHRRREVDQIVSGYWAKHIAGAKLSWLRTAGGLPNAWVVEVSGPDAYWWAEQIVYTLRQGKPFGKGAMEKATKHYPGHVVREISAKELSE